MFAGEWNTLTEKMTTAFEEWLGQFSHEYKEVECSVKDSLEWDFKSTLDAMNWEDEDITPDDVIADVILSLEGIDVEDYPELIFTQDIWQVFDDHTQKCESALADFGGVQECDNICDAVSTAVHAYLAEEANLLMYDVKEELEELEEMLSM